MRSVNENLQIIAGLKGGMTDAQYLQYIADSVAAGGGGGGGGSGTVTSVSVTTANGVSGTVANATTTPALTLSLGAITPSTVTTGANTQQQFSTDAVGPIHEFHKARGTSGSPTGVAFGDLLGGVHWDSYDGTQYYPTGKIDLSAISGPTGTHITTEMDFYAGDGAHPSLLENLLRIAGGDPYPFVGVQGPLIIYDGIPSVGSSEATNPSFAFAYETSSVTPKNGIRGGNVTNTLYFYTNATLHASLDNSGHFTIEGVTSTGATGTGKFVFDTTPTISDPILADVGPSSTLSVGFRGIPQNPQSGNYTLVLADAGKHIYHASGDGAGDTYTIPANGTVAYPIGTAVTFVNLDSNSVSIAITSDTMYLGGNGSTGTRTLSQYGVATAVKVASTIWVISGSGLN